VADVFILGRERCRVHPTALGGKLSRRLSGPQIRSEIGAAPLLPVDVNRPQNWRDRSGKDGTFLRVQSRRILRGRPRSERCTQLFRLYPSAFS